MNPGSGPPSPGRPPAARPTRLEGSFLEVPGGRLWVEQAGHGPPVLFAHAGIADSRMWDGQVAALAGRYRVIRYDQRGFGRSPTPEGLFSHVADMHAVLDHASPREAVLVGSSVGGATIIDYALAQPRRVAALVPVAAGLSGYPWGSWSAEFDAAVKSGNRDRAMQTAMRLVAPLRTEPGVDQRIRQLLAGALPGLAGLGTKWAAWTPAYGRLGNIRVPALAVVGDHDQADFIRIARLIASEIPGARLEILPATDHNVPVRAEAAFTGLLASFLDSLPRWPSAVSSA